MTELKAAQIERALSNPPAGVVAALIFGPDQGLVRERAEMMTKAIVLDLKDPFLIADLDDGVLVSDPGRLFDEAAAIAMLGGRRVVRVRGAGNNLAKLFEKFLDEPAGDALVVVEGGDLTKGTGLRRVFEAADNAVSVACYGDSVRNLPDIISDALRVYGLTIEPQALAEATGRLGSDRGVTRSELEKLALYAHGQRKVSLADVRAVLGDEVEARMEEALDSAGLGDLKRLDVALERLWIAGTSPIGVVRVALSHFQRLALVKAETDNGTPTDVALKKLRPPLHFMRADSFRAQLGLWTSDLLMDALDGLLQTELLCKTTAIPAETVTSRAFFNIAARARRR